MFVLIVLSVVSEVSVKNGMDIGSPYLYCLDKRLAGPDLKAQSRVMIGVPTDILSCPPLPHTRNLSLLVPPPCFVPPSAILLPLPSAVVLPPLSTVICSQPLCFIRPCLVPLSLTMALPGYFHFYSLIQNPLSLSTVPTSIKSIGSPSGQDLNRNVDC